MVACCRYFSSFLFKVSVSLLLGFEHTGIFKGDGRSHIFVSGDTGGAGADVWGEECRLGQLQSPVDIRDKEYGTRLGGISTLWVNHPYVTHSSGFYAADTGLTFQVQFTGNRTNPTSPLVMSGAGLRQSYTFAQMHFHWGDTDDEGSEHTLEGVSYPLELHLVHFKSVHQNLSNALNERDPESIAVLAVLFKLGEENPALEPIVAAARSPTVQDPQPAFQLFSNLTLKVASLFPGNLDFIRYDGSLTTPPCSERVVWSVFLNPVTISKSQLDVFRNLRNFEKKRIRHNFRPVQLLNGRAVKYFTNLGLRTGVFPRARVQDDLYTALTSFGSLLREFFQGIRTTYYFKPTVG